jgi:hypothetical protein
MLPPGTYTPKLIDDLQWYIIQELRRTMSDRNLLENEWVRYEELYRARPAEGVKDFPV